MSDMKELLASLQATIKEGEESNLSKRISSIPNISSILSKDEDTNKNNHVPHDTKPVLVRKDIDYIDRIKVLKKLEQQIPQELSHSSYLDDAAISDIIGLGLKGAIEAGVDYEQIELVNTSDVREFLFDVSEQISQRVVRNINLYRSEFELDELMKPVLYDDEFRNGASRIFNKNSWQKLAVLGSNLRLNAMADMIFFNEIMSDLEFVEYGTHLSIYFVVKRYKRSKINSDNLSDLTNYYYEYNYQVNKKGYKWTQDKKSL